MDQTGQERTMRGGLRLAAAALVVVSGLMFGAGLALPLFTVTPGAGPWTPLLRVLVIEQFQPVTYTLPGSVAMLWTDGELVLAALLALLSLALPVGKFCVLWWELTGHGVLPGWVPPFFRAVSHYAMIEVFLVSLTVLLIKGLPGGSQVHLHAGVWMFAVSVALSLMASRMIPERRVG